MLSITWAQAAAWRVRRHHLEKRARAGALLDVASRLCGLHAQVMSSAELTAWARVEGLARTAVQRALWERRTLVKTWAMRGTLHVLPARDLPVWYSALSTSPRYLSPARWQNAFGISLREVERLSDCIAEALDGRVMTREALMHEVSRISGSAAFSARVVESSWGTILKPAAFSGRLCFGPNVGTRVQFTRPDSWLPGGMQLIDTKEATAEAARRFLAAHGPASMHDLARWWGGGMATVRAWIAALGDEVSAVEIDGTKAYILAKDERALARCEPCRTVRLLPAFDQYVIVASYHAGRLLPGDLRGRVYRPQGWVSPVLMIDGRMEGVWRHETKGSRVEVTIEPFRGVPAWARKGAREEAERLAAYLGGSLNLKWSPMR